MTISELPAFHCGPLELHVGGGPPELVAKVADALSLFDHRWDAPHRQVHIEAMAAPAVAMVEGTFLTCARMTVRADGADGLEATTVTGAGGLGRSMDASDAWTITAPPDAIAAGALEDVEDLVGLALTTGWRSAGWVPVHAACVVHPRGTCAVLCAPSGGGKSTLTAALVRRGWQVIGDDKLLLRTGSDGRTQVAALLHTFNLHPSTSAWFPEIGDLELLPQYSAWTPKRKVKVGSIWEAATASDGVPTHIVMLHRTGSPGSIETTLLPPGAALSVLLRQAVIPTEPRIAAMIARTIVACASQTRGLAVRVGDGAYRFDDALDSVEDALLA